MSPQERVGLAQHVGSRRFVAQAVLEILVHNELAGLTSAAQLLVHSARLVDVDVEIHRAVEHEDWCFERLRVLGW